MTHARDAGKSEGTAVAPARPRNEVLEDITLRLTGLEAVIGELRSPHAEEVLVDFVSLMRCRLGPLREGLEKPPRTKMGGYKPFTDDDPDDSAAADPADDADDGSVDDAVDVES